MEGRASSPSRRSTLGESSTHVPLKPSVSPAPITVAAEKTPRPYQPQQPAASRKSESQRPYKASKSGFVASVVSAKK